MTPEELLEAFRWSEEQRAAILTSLESLISERDITNSFYSLSFEISNEWRRNCFSTQNTLGKLFDYALKVGNLASEPMPVALHEEVTAALSIGRIRHHFHKGKEE
jgi:hypothetical protein